jgi:UDP-2,3-diacylglucosamine pyrophosphatase LpxH
LESKTNRRKRVFLSDIHMGAGRSPGAGKWSYDWLGFAQADHLARFLQDLKGDASVAEVILLGDILDDWVCPVDEVPPTFEEIVGAAHNATLVRALCELAAAPEVSVVYLPGNHDMGVTEKFVARTFPGMKFGGSGWNNSAFRSGRLLAEHGNAHTMFNAPDPLNDPRRRLPLGYFITRVVTTMMHRTGDSSRDLVSWTDDLLELVGPQRVAASVFEALLEEADLEDDEPIRMLRKSGREYAVVARDVKARYADLYQRWETQVGPGLAFKSLLCEIGCLDDTADRLCKKGDTNVVVFGHSHEWKLDKDSWFVADRIYANCGSWCDPDRPGTYVETEQLAPNHARKRERVVRVCAWQDGERTTLAEESVPV